MSWVHIDDLISMILYVVNNEFNQGAINATAANPVTNKIFSSTLARISKRPAFLPMPPLLLQLLSGEVAQESLLLGQRAIPTKMLESGYEFHYSELKNAWCEITQ